jgi:malate permease and related proteins
LDNIILALSVVFPLMIMMFVGYELRRFHVVDEPSLNVMNKMTFKVFLPLLLFHNIYSLEAEEVLNKENAKLILLTACCILAAVIVSWFVFSITVKNKRKCSVMIQGVFRSNLVLFGIPVAASIYGENHIGSVSLLAASIVPLFNILAVTVLEVYRGDKIQMKKVLIGIMKNPLIIASVIAVSFILLGIQLPKLIISPVESMAKVATPLAFIVLGGTFHFNRLGENRNYLIVVTLGKLIILPGIVFFLAYLLRFRYEAIVALIGAVASPTAVSSFTMAKEMNADDELAGQIVVLTSVMSILTIFLWVLFLKTIGLI